MENSMEKAELKKITVPPAKFIVGLKQRFIFQLSMLHILWIALSVYRNPFLAFRVLKKLMQKRQAVHGNLPIRKYVKSGKYYFWALNAPGWPSGPFRRFIENELNKLQPFRETNGFLQTMIFAVTNKCPLKCEHCFEWKNLDSTESLTLDDLKTILGKFQTRGILQIQFSGGEPLSRFDDLIELLKSARTGTDCWVLTSGFGLTANKACRLKDAGITGVNISLDHWNENSHNHFRHHEKSFDWVKQAALNCRHADILVAFSLCAVREFVSDDNLRKYLELAKALGAGFIQLLEPRKVGHFQGKDVELGERHLEIMKHFYLKVNSDPAYLEYPIVMYPGFHQRLLGCFGAGNRYLYVDSNGDLHACPFCQHKTGNALTDSLSESIQKMQATGCHEFKTIAWE
jgi:MoaA/NifB/PqqE/SkfB family radical SAM enzyme